MPFEARFNQIADVIKTTVTGVIADFSSAAFPGLELPEIKRLDWVTSSGVIQGEIWKEVYGADLVFCDITGYNANVIFEAGVSAAWKRIEQVVFIRDHFYKGQSPFDLAPIRYTEYELTSDGIAIFKQKLQQLVRDAMIALPDTQGSSPPVTLPLRIDFLGGNDDLRIYTPPFAHRRVLDNALEFGSFFFSHSWATLGKGAFLNFDLRFKTRFTITQPGAYMGIGLRSQHFYANFAHILYLKLDGTIVLTQPNENPPNFYTDMTIRESTPINVTGDHEFHIRFEERTLSVEVDDFRRSFDVAQMPKVLGPGLIRFQCYMCRMAVAEVSLS
jgi:hypothetical protein